MKNSPFGWKAFAERSLSPPRDARRASARVCALTPPPRGCEGERRNPQGVATRGSGWGCGNIQNANKSLVCAERKHNEIVLRTVKSSRCSEEIFGFASDEIKSASNHPASAGFHREAISSTAGRFLPPSADLVKKRASRLRCSFFWLPLLGLNQRPHD